jgi:hypothetical protein
MSDLTVSELTRLFGNLSLKSSPERKAKVEQWLLDGYSDECEPLDSKTDETIIIDELQCPCWISPLYPYCRTNCMLQFSKEYEEICQCSKSDISSAVVKAKSCDRCIEELRSKRFLVRAITLQCSCYRDYEYKLVRRDRSGVKRKLFARIARREARSCSRCVLQVRRMLESGNYPACICKDKNSTDLAHCRPFCRWHVSEIYAEWFRERPMPLLTVWRKASQKVLPTCECWEPFVRAECIPSCSRQLSKICSALYEESCPCKPNAVHRISDEYCWVFRCASCKPQALLSSAKSLPEISSTCDGEDSGPLRVGKRAA